MKYYSSTTEFNCGIDLHAHQMYVCVMDPQGKKRVHTSLRSQRSASEDCRAVAKRNGNKFKANSVVAIKLARAVYYMLKNKTVFDPQRLISVLARN